MGTLLWILLATVLNSLVALAGVVSLAVSRKTLDRLLIALVGFSAGALLSGAFFHLLAESLERMQSTTAFIYVFAGFILFFIIERFLHWHHCHKGKCDVHTFNYLILIGDGIHNFIDGLIIATSFMVDVSFGIVTTLLIMGHEVPQEIGDFGVLVYGGFGRKKALLFNLLSQCTCIIGGLAGFFFSQASAASVFLLPFAAGGFIYIGASDLVPELHREPRMKRAVVSFLFFLAGIGAMAAIKFAVG